MARTRLWPALMAVALTLAVLGAVAASPIFGGDYRSIETPIPPSDQPSR